MDIKLYSDYDDFELDEGSDEEEIETSSKAIEEGTGSNAFFSRVMKIGESSISESIRDEYEDEMEIELHKKAVQLENLHGFDVFQDVFNRDSPKKAIQDDSLETKNQACIRQDSPCFQLNKSLVNSAKEVRKKKVRFSSCSDLEQGLPRSEKKLSRSDESNHVEDEESNDALLYDPNSDKQDEEWINNRRESSITKLTDSISDKQHHSSIHGSEKMNASVESKPMFNRSLPDSDAILNCPACFTLLCMDCQKHDFYQGQFRAMFVMNCSIKFDQQRKVPLTSKRKAKSRKRKVHGEPIMDSSRSQPLPAGRSHDLNQDDEDKLFSSVSCSICNTEVAMYDSTDELYHFFNVLTSYT